MNLADVELFLIELAATGGPVRSLIVRLATDAGLEGWGETRFAGSVENVASLRRALSAVLAGRSAFDVEAILALDVVSTPAVACGVEMALWDLIARDAGQPLCHLWGGCYRDRVPVSVRLPDGSPSAVADCARAFATQAIGSQTVTSTGNCDDDVLLTVAVRDACGARTVLRFDGQRNYDLRTAGRLCVGLEPLSMQFLLDPLAERAAELLGALRARAAMPVAVMQSVAGPADVMRVARTEAASFVIVDPVRVGGLLRARQCAVVAEAAGLAASLSIEGTSGLALAATLQLAAATPSFTSGHECAYPKLHDDILSERLPMVDGMLAVPTAPGLGVEVDRDKLDRRQLVG